MNVLILAYSYYPSRNGVQKVTQYQAEGLVRLGHTVTVVSDGTNAKGEENINGVEIKRIKAKTDFMLHFGDKYKYIRMVQDLSKRVDVIMCVCPQGWSTDWIIPVIKDIPCAKVMMVHGIHNFSWKNFKDRSLYGFARKLWGDIRWRPYFWRNWKNIKRFDEIIQLHEHDFATQYFSKHGVKNQRILYNAVDDEFFEECPKKKNQIINVGTYSPGKNQLTCLKAFYEADIPDWKLVLIGPQKNKYYNRVVAYKAFLDKKFGYRHVDIKVGISRAETINEVMQSKIYLLTSISEMFPVSLIESMAAGCTWISTDVGINRYLPGGEICKTSLEMAQEIERIVENKYWLTKGKLAKKFTQENCRKSVQVKSLEHILIAAINENAKRV